jgi:anti-sigma regulatory factor (Ser/Thr protein kinase)
LPSENGSVRDGRRWLREELTGSLGADHPAIDGALQALSEVLTNAVLYGTGSDVRVSCSFADRGVVVTVENQAAPDGPRPRRGSLGQAAETAESGRGLVLVSAYCAEWGWEETPGSGVRVWFRLGT